MHKLIIKDLSKTYSNGVKALNNISIEIENGLFGLLGPNGAGKSSLMRTLATLQEADSVSEINDIDIFSNLINSILDIAPRVWCFSRISAEQLLNHLVS